MLKYSFGRPAWHAGWIWSEAPDRRGNGGGGGGEEDRGVEAVKVVEVVVRWRAGCAGREVVSAVVVAVVVVVAVGVVGVVLTGKHDLRGNLPRELTTGLADCCGTRRGLPFWRIAGCRKA